MRAMILAAGRGERMGPLTAETPKPLLRVAGKYLIEYAITHLKRAGICDIVINISYYAEQIKAALGEGERYGVKLYYSEEPQRLETGGGIVNALPFLGPHPFLVMSSDIITNYPLEQLLHQPIELAHLVLVDNPPYHAQGDFGLEDGYVNQAAKPSLTFANIGVYHPKLFADCQAGYFRLSEILNPAISVRKVTGEFYAGTWFNVGTPQDFSEANRFLKHSFADNE